MTYKPSKDRPFIERLKVPTEVYLKKKTKADEKVILNFNSYRNMNRFKLGHVKNEFNRIFMPEVERWVNEYSHLLDYDKSLFKVKLKYIITSANQRKFDVANILSIVDKFACDCLVKAGVMEDDNWQFMSGVEYNFGGVTGERSCFLSITVA